MQNDRRLDRELAERVLSSKVTRREAIRAAGGVSLAGLLAACAPTSTTPSAPAPTSAASATAPAVASTDTLTMGLASLGTQNPDPHYNAGLDRLFMWSISENLARRELDGKVVPNLAT